MHCKKLSAAGRIPGQSFVPTFRLLWHIPRVSARGNDLQLPPRSDSAFQQGVKKLMSKHK
jgi:hypothetical protein